MKLLVNNYINCLKKIIIKNELKFLYFFLILSVFNNFSHFIRKNILGDRIDFWDFHVYWCSANKLVLNLDKTCYMFFKPKDKDSSLKFFFVGNREIHRGNYTKLFGVQIDAN